VVDDEMRLLIDEDELKAEALGSYFNPRKTIACMSANSWHPDQTIEEAEEEEEALANLAISLRNISTESNPNLLQ